MSLLYNARRAYDPETLGIMTTAFDNALVHLPQKVKENEFARRKLARLVMRYIERGERDPERVSVSAALDFLRW